LPYSDPSSIPAPSKTKTLSGSYVNWLVPE
jgi:hypothetical protein